MPEKVLVDNGFRHPLTTVRHSCLWIMAHHWRRRPFGFLRMVRTERRFGSHRVPVRASVLDTFRVSRAAAFSCVRCLCGRENYREFLDRSFSGLV